MPLPHLLLLLTGLHVWARVLFPHIHVLQILALAVYLRIFDVDLLLRSATSPGDSS